MNLLEIDALSISDSDLKLLVLGLEESDTPLLLRNGLARMDQEDWFNFLETQCLLRSDKRHPVGRADRWRLNDKYKIKYQRWGEISYQPDKAMAYAFSKTRQPLHTDNAFLRNGPSLNFNVMVKQACRGGSTTIYAVRRVIRALEAQAPALLNRLLTYEISVQKGDNEPPNVTQALTRNNGGEASWNYYRTVKDRPKIAKMAEDFFRFLDDCEEQKLVDLVHLNTGDCLAWNDNKILHGRTAFEATKPFDRILRQSMWHFS